MVYLCVSLYYFFLPKDLESTPKTISFAKNGTFFGTAYELGTELRNEALFPHIATKNVEFTVNFSSPVWCETPDSEGYLSTEEAQEEHKVRAPKVPASKDEC